LLNEHVAIDFDADTVAKELNIPIGTVRSNLSRLKGDGAIEKRASNKYGAVTPK
jgi:DNA-binding GntR family transcriptional regulator